MTHSAPSAPQPGSQASSGLPAAGYPTEAYPAAAYPTEAYPAADQPAAVSPAGSPAPSYPSLSSVPQYWTADQAPAQLPAQPPHPVSPQHPAPAQYAQPQYAQPQYAQPQYAQPQYASADAPTQRYDDAQAVTLPYAATTSPAVAPQQPQAYQEQPYQGQAYPSQPYPTLSSESQSYEGQPYDDYRQVPVQDAEGPGAGRRPVALTAALGVGLLASVLVVASQVLGLIGGRATLEAWMVERLSVGAGAFNPVQIAMLDDAYGQLQLRAYVSIGVAVVMAVMIVLSVRAGAIARSFSVVFMGVAALGTLISLWDIFPGVAKAVGAGALVLLPVVTLLLFAPAVSRYRSMHRPPQQAAT